MEFKKYQHIERFGTEEVEAIELGEVVIFPKIDGCNGSVYMGDDHFIKSASRNRELTIDNDNQGFCAYVLQNDNLLYYMEEHPEHRLYGEWLVPHSLKTYRKEAWRKFYIFDVCVDCGDGLEYIPYDIYQPMLEEFNLDYIIPICKIKNGNYEYFQKAIEKNFFLIEDGQGLGEGIVLKNYDYYNKYGRQTWAKMVTNEFKEKHARVMGIPDIEATKMVEDSITEKYCTAAFIEKEYAKIVSEKDGWQSRYIPELLGRVFSELIKEESWNMIKEYKNPRINYKILNALVIQKVKQVKVNIFN